MELSTLYQWLKTNNLADRVPSSVDFKISQLKQAVENEKNHIYRAKQNLNQYFSIDEYDFGFKQYSVKIDIESLIKAYDDYISKSSSLNSDIAALHNEEDNSAENLDFLLEIKELNLSNSAITELPHEITLLKNLNRLNISNTNITKIDKKIANTSNFTLDISGTAIKITHDLLENLKSSDYSSPKIVFDLNTSIDEDCKNLSFVRQQIQQFIEQEVDPIKKINLANDYHINKIKIDPNHLTDDFFQLDFSTIDFIDMMSDSVDEAMANKIVTLAVDSIAFAYDTTVADLEKRMLATAITKEEFEQYQEDIWTDIDFEDGDLELTVISYMNLNSSYSGNKDLMKAIYYSAFSLKTSGEKVIVIENEDTTIKVVSLEGEDSLGYQEWQYYSTDTNDGAMDRYINYCSAELYNIKIEDIFAFRLNHKEVKELVNEYAIDYDCEQEGYYSN